MDQQHGDEHAPRSRSHNRDLVQPQLHRDDEAQRAQLGPLPGRERAARRRLSLRHSSQPSRKPAPMPAVIGVASAPSRRIPSRPDLRG
jgi:hypothetical protein